MSTSLSQSILTRGDARIINVTVLAADRKTPVDISGSTAYFTLSSNSAPTDDTTAAVRKVWTYHIDPINGRTSVKLLGADTQDLVPGIYYYDVQIVNPIGDPISTYRRSITLRSDITRTV